jgi:tetratricopeptide (TPR) repeat protein
MHRQARLELTGLLHAEGRYAEAIEVEEVLLQTHPEESDTWRTDLAVLRVAKGEADAGLAELRRLAEEHADEPAWWIVLASEARIEGRFSESQEAIDRALAVSSEDSAEDLAEVHYQQYLLQKDMKQLDDAVAAWEKAVALDADKGKTVREVYTAFTEVGRYSDALRYVDRDDNPLQAGLQRGLIAHMTAHPIEARQHWQQVTELNAADFEYGQDAWVEAVLRLGDPEPALEWLQAYLPQYASPRLLVLSGIGWAMRQDHELAAGLFQQAINLQRRGRPPKQKLDSAEWRLLDSLVDDDELKTSLKTYFAVVETLWA